jgi:hypothetical protein
MNPEEGNGAYSTEDSARKMIDGAYPEENVTIHEVATKKPEERSEEDKDLIASMGQNPETFLYKLGYVPAYEDIRGKIFHPTEGAVIEADPSSRDLRPAGKVEIKGGTVFVGGWEVDPLGFYVGPPTSEPKERYAQKKVNWINDHYFRNN